MSSFAAVSPTPNFRNLGQQLRGMAFGALALSATLALLGAAAGAAMGAFTGIFGPPPNSFFQPIDRVGMAVGASVYDEVIVGFLGALAGALQGMLWGVLLWKSDDLPRRLREVTRGSARGALAGACLGAFLGAIGYAFIGGCLNFWSNVLLPLIWTTSGSWDSSWGGDASYGGLVGIFLGAFFGAGAGARAHLNGIAPQYLSAKLARLGPLAMPLGNWFARSEERAGDDSTPLEPAETSLFAAARQAIPLQYVPPMGFFQMLAILMFIGFTGTGLSWNEFRVPLACVALGWLCAWVRRPEAQRHAALHPSNPNDRRSVPLNVLCFLVPPLGLLSWLALDNRTPQRARSAGRSAVRGAVLLYGIYSVLMMGWLVTLACDAIEVARLTPINPVKMEACIASKRQLWYTRHGIARAPLHDSFTTDHPLTWMELYRTTRAGTH